MAEVTTKDVRVLKVYAPSGAPEVVSLRVDGYGVFVDFSKDPRRPGKVTHKVTYPKGEVVPAFLMTPMRKCAYAILFPAPPK